MTITVTWNRPDGTKPSMELNVNPNDPHKDDKELQVAKARAAAIVGFKNQFHEQPDSKDLAISVS